MTHPGLEPGTYRSRDINQPVYCVVLRLLCLHSVQERKKIVYCVYCVYCVYPVSSQLHPNCTRKGDSCKNSNCKEFGNLVYWIYSHT